MLESGTAPYFDIPTAVCDSVLGKHRHLVNINKYEGRASLQEPITRRSVQLRNESGPIALVLDHIQSG